MRWRRALRVNLNLTTLSIMLDRKNIVKHNSDNHRTPGMGREPRGTRL